MRASQARTVVLAPVLVGIGAILGNSCYQLEIDLSPLLDASASQPMGGAQDLGTGHGDEAGAASHVAGGASGADSMGGAGGAGGVLCDEIVRDTADDHACRLGLLATRAECAPQPQQGWRGCYDGGCSVCTVDGTLPGYPYYFKWHPCCIPNDTCSNHEPMLCNDRCPPPSEHDRIPPCGVLDPNPG